MKVIKFEGTVQCHPATDSDGANGVCGFTTTELQRLADYFARDGHVLKFEAAVEEGAEGDETA